MCYNNIEKTTGLKQICFSSVYNYTCGGMKMEEKKIVLRTAVLSDIHIPYRSNGNLKLLTKNYERLASAISKLNILAD